jgi:hypothetical protein
MKSQVITTRSGYYYKGGPEHRKFFLGSTWLEARGVLRQIRRGEIKVPERRSLAARAIVRDQTRQRLEWDMARVEKMLLVGVRKRSAGAEHLSADEIQQLLARASGRCELTGIPFSAVRIDGCSKRPWTPSIDRIDNAKPYTLSNCRVVCTAVNLALNEFGETILRRIAWSLVTGKVSEK